MAKWNKELIKKLDMFEADLDGGLLDGEKATKFLKKAIDESVIQKYARTMTLPAGSYTIPKLGFNDRILRRGQEAVALTEAERAKPNIDSVKIVTQEYIAEVRLSYDVLMHNVEKNGIEKTIKDAMAGRIGLDVDDLVLNGDLTSLDPFFNAQNGFRLSAGLDVDLAGAIFNKSAMKTMTAAMPAKFKRNKQNLAFFASTLSEENYRDQLSSRATAMGDKYTEGIAPVFYNASRIISTPIMSEEFGTAPNFRTQALFTDPRNMIIGYENRVHFEMERDISARVLKIVATIWVGSIYEDADAVVRAINVGL